MAHKEEWNSPRLSGVLSEADADEFREYSREWTRKITRSKKAARAALVKAGFNTPDGKLTKEYSG